MTEFEQQVAEAIDAALKAGFESDPSFNGVSRGQYLAPHVAAAILAGARAVERAYGPICTVGPDPAIPAALAALRGGASSEGTP